MKAGKRVSIPSDRKMVDPRTGKRLVHEGEPTALLGWATVSPGGVQYVQLDDGREVLVADADMTEVST